MKEIERCPFCGGNPKINARQSKFCGKNAIGNVKLIWTIYVKCNRCHSRGKPIKTEPIKLYEGERCSLGSGNFYNTEFWRGTGRGLMTATLTFEPYVEKAIESWNRRHNNGC